jgi:hypothetical protein
MKVQWSEQLDATTWGPVTRRPGISHLLTIPRWLGGGWSAGYIVRHAWTRWLILLPIIKWKEWRSHTAGEQHE